MPFSDAFDMASSTKHDLESITKINVPLTMMTDSLSLFDALTKATSMTEKNL